MRLICLLTVLVLMSGSLKGADDPKVKILQTGDIELDVQDKQHQVLIPIGLDSGLRDKKIEVSVVSVKRNNIIYPGLRAAFQPKIQESALVIDYLLDKLRDVGKYELILEVREKTTKLLEYPTLVLVYPEGALAAPTSLTVSLTSYGVHDYTNEAPPLSLSESSGASSINNLKLPVLLFSGDCTTYRQLRFVPNVVSLSPNQSQSVRYRLEGDFPLGSSQATYVLSTPGNKASTIKVEVNNRLSKLFILLAIIAGISVGYGLRQVIAPRKKLAGYRLQGFQQIKQLQQIRRENHDTVFKQACEHIEKKVQSAIDVLSKSSHSNDSFTKFDDAMKKADTDLEAALNDLQQRRDTLKASAESLRQTLSAPYQLPTLILDQLEKAKQEMSPIEDALKEGNFSEGQRQLTDLLALNREELNKLLKAYRDTRDAGVSLGIRADLPQELLDARNKVIEWASQPDTFELLEIKISTEELRTELEQWSTDYTNWRKEVVRFANTLNSYFLGVLADMKQKAVFNSSEITNLSSTLDAYIKSLMNEDRYVDPGHPVLNNEDLTVFADQWYQFFADIPNQTDAFKVCLTTRDYKGAVQQIRGESLESVPEPSKIKTNFTASADVNSKSYHFEQQPFGPLKAASTTATIQTLVSEQATWGWLETILSGLLICLLGYQLYEKTFVGTWAELIAIFFWGFGLDITASSLSDTVKKVIKT